MKNALAVSLCLAAALGAPAAQAQAPRTLTISVQTSETDLAAQALANFARTVETGTRGAVRVRYRYQVMDVSAAALRSGALHGALLLRDDLEAVCPSVAAFRVPSVFPDLATMDRIFASLRGDVESSCGTNVTVLGWTLPGPRYLFVSSPEEPTEGVLTNIALAESSAAQTAYFGYRSTVATPGSGVVVAPGERGLFTNLNRMAPTPVGMDLGALVINTAALSALTPEQQRVVRDAASATAQGLTRSLRAVTPAGATIIPESPAWTAWVSASRSRALADTNLLPMLSRMLMMLGPVNPVQTSPNEVVPAPPPGRPPPSTAAPVQAATPAPAVSAPGIDLPFVDVPPPLVEVGYPRAVSALRSRIMRCYEPGLRAPTPLAGQITLSLRVLPNGSVTGVRTLNDPGLTTITDAVLTRCVESLFRALRVPGLEADAVAVRQTVVFRAR